MTLARLHFKAAKAATERHTTMEAMGHIREAEKVLLAEGSDLHREELDDLLIQRAWTKHHTGEFRSVQPRQRF